jgi:hypothetical protein
LGSALIASSRALLDVGTNMTAFAEYAPNAKIPNKKDAKVFFMLVTFFGK